MCFMICMHDMTHKVHAHNALIFKQLYGGVYVCSQDASALVVNINEQPSKSS